MNFEFKEETRKLIGCAMEVHRGLGPGLHEKPYENALVVEFGLQDIPCEQQRSFDVEYKGVEVAKFIPDLIIFGKIIVDLKAIQEISPREIGQMMTYLRVTGLPLGLIFNFSAASLQWKRVALSQSKPSTSEINLR